MVNMTPEECDVSHPSSIYETIAMTSEDMSVCSTELNELDMEKMVNGAWPMGDFNN